MTSAALVNSACRRAAEPQATATQPDQALTETSKKQLQNIGYLEYVPDDDDDDRRGVTIHDADRMHAGYTLYGVHSKCRADLIDAAGRVAHAWSLPGRHWANCEIQPNGDLLLVGADTTHSAGTIIDPKDSFLMRLNWQGEVVFKHRLPAHHDVEITPRGQYVTLNRGYRLIPKFDAEIQVKDNALVLLSADLETASELSMFDAMSAAGFALQAVDPKNAPASRHFDLFHANSVEWMHQEHLFDRDPIYGPDNVLVSIRHQDAAAIFNWRSKKLVWSWGPGEISGPHDATVLENGNILLYDNGLGRDWSRVIELDPLKKKIVWQYKAATPSDFYSRSRGSNQRLPNGNTLITESDRGRIFEVTRNGAIVWEFITPHADHRDRRATIVRSRRYETRFIDPLRERFAVQPEEQS